MVSDPNIFVVKASGERQNFDSEKLLGSLVSAGAKPKEAEDIVSHVFKEIEDGMSTDQIFRHAFFLLKKKSKPVALKYSLRRAVMTLGPSGFPFEDFLAEIFKFRSYHTLTDQTVLGGCVPHEVDVVAWNENKLIMAEAKFHNETGIKTDLKVVLYVKARFDDLKQNKFDYGKIRTLDEGWLMTNTKFTETAIHYGECQGLTLIGWNYPKKGNLQDLIEDSDLHPITCLTSLSQAQKNLILGQGVVLAKKLKEEPGILRSIGFNDKKAKEVINEINEL